jgi:hypothetical protein
MARKRAGSIGRVVEPYALWVAAYGDGSTASLCAWQQKRDYPTYTRAYASANASYAETEPPSGHVCFF